MTGANVARAMQLSAPTVHEMVGRLERDGYITRAADKSISFTADGLEHAEAHRPPPPADRALPDRRAEIPWDDVHEEAERLEHAMSPVLEARMLAAIGDAKTCPHGHPIKPGTRIEGVPLGDTEPGAQGHRPALRERGRGPAAPVQARGLRARARGHASASVDDEHVTVDFNGDTATLTRSVAETVSVLADPSPPPRTALPEQLVLGKERYGR